MAGRHAACGPIGASSSTYWSDNGLSPRLAHLLLLLASLLAPRQASEQLAALRRFAGSKPRGACWL